MSLESRSTKASLVALTLQDNLTIEQWLAAELADVESRFTAELASDLDCVNTLIGHIERYRGKMLRPTLVLLCGAACQPKEAPVAEPHRVLAAVVEMVHMATLVHDDILDDAQIRRRGGTINHLCGNEAAVMLGDYLISHAYHLCSSLGDPTISQAIAQATNTVCEGELLQLANRNHWQLNERTYFEIIRRKTATLCGVCGQLAATLSHAPANVVELMRAYAQKLGVAFQIIDDVLDVAGDPQTVGKTLGRDLEKGKLTLPLIHCLAGATDQDRREMTAWLDARAQRRDAEISESMNSPSDWQPNHDRAAWLQRRILDGDSLDYCRDWAQKLVEDAKEPIRGNLPDSPTRRLLLDMADAIVTRRY